MNKLVTKIMKKKLLQGNNFEWVEGIIDSDNGSIYDYSYRGTLSLCSLSNKIYLDTYSGSSGGTNWSEREVEIASLSDIEKMAKDYISFAKKEKFSIIELINNRKAGKFSGRDFYTLWNEIDCETNKSLSVKELAEKKKRERLSKIRLSQEKRGLSKLKKQLGKIKAKKKSAKKALRKKERFSKELLSEYEKKVSIKDILKLEEKEKKLHNKLNYVVEKIEKIKNK
jgi:hypothetical protein